MNNDYRGVTDKNYANNYYENCIETLESDDFFSFWHRCSGMQYCRWAL
ncbi:hypothetical protein IMPR6_280035 [Imperialibacter sp. EC-SDR9]|nr:hypothetical protein IMPERIA89_240030 [Imperialibacter sp. 89]CAD5271858.1 hypothetical protein IMPERIA75_390030 [Imperialibacter sp. 75]VVT19022.1 hypothetical protein IMPR6_280035 [Imperialibacter sp. EC-SDR9]